MELQQLRYFKCVAETGRINAAARALYVSPAAVSSSVTKLEKELGCTLFDRSSSGLCLNRSGQILKKYVDQVLRTLDDAQTELAKASEHERKHISIAVTTSNIWAGLICAFSLEYPQITLSYTTLRLSQLQPGVYAKYDFLIAEERDFETDELCSQVLIDDDRPVLMVPPEHPLARETSVDLREHRQENYILPGADLSMHRMASEVFRAAGIRQNDLHEYTYILRCNAVLTHQGVSFSTYYSSRNEDPGICYVPIAWPVCRWTQRICWSRLRTLSTEEELFLRFAVDYFRRETPPEPNSSGFSASSDI